VVIEEFGTGSFLVRAVPAIMGKIEGTEQIDDLVTDLVESDPTRPVTDRERITRIVACRSGDKSRHGLHARTVPAARCPAPGSGMPVYLPTRAAHDDSVLPGEAG
jgi:DNA mismatch repair enzyme (predicted ATPase)